MKVNEAFGLVELVMPLFERDDKIQRITVRHGMGPAAVDIIVRRDGNISIQPQREKTDYRP